MAYHPRIESKTHASFLTTRSIRSELWFINNRPLEEAILAYAAKFADRYSVKLYGLAIEGNHIQGPALFPKANRAAFMRDFNSCVARAIPRYTPEHGGGRFWGRRYSSEFLLAPEDIEEYFFYTVLQPVQDGLVEKISEYPRYNCFHDAVCGISRRYKFVEWGEYNAKKRYNSNASIRDYTRVVHLKYDRLPGYEHLSQKEYIKVMSEKLEGRRIAIVKARYAAGGSFMGREKLLRLKRGSIPKKTKTSSLTSHRPRILSVCNKRRAEGRAWYFQIYFDYKAASREYRAGNVAVRFPQGTYRPYCPQIPPD